MALSSGVGPWGSALLVQSPELEEEGHEAGTGCLQVSPEQTGPLLSPPSPDFLYLVFPAAQSTPVQYQVLLQPHPVQPLHVLDGRTDPTGLRL